MIYIRRFLPMLLFLLSFGAFADTEKDIAATMEARLLELVNVLSKEQGDAALDAVLVKTIDSAAITKGVLGKHRKSLTESQTTRFQSEFDRSMKHLLVTALSSVGKFDLSIEKVKLRGEQRAQVFAVVKTEKSEKFEIVSSIGRDTDEWLVRNLIVNGVNLGLTYRNQFNELMLNHGDADKAIDAWSETIEEAADGAI